MKIIFISYLCILTLPILVTALNSLASTRSDTNLTNWREHRRKKRFILFENSGVSKMVCGITYPVDLGEKKLWRQLVTTYNIQFQFAVPPAPIYWWDKWDRRNLDTNPAIDKKVTLEPPEQTDEAQQFLYELAENFMHRRGNNGRECMLKAICENAQIHEHRGLYSELLHRVLRPHRHLEQHFVDAWKKGKHGIDCQVHYAAAQNCWLDQFTHVREDFMDQTTVT